MLVKNIVVIPDSFKGAVTSSEASGAITEGLRQVLPDAAITQIPVADGGEGTVDAMLAAGTGRSITAQVCGVFPGESINATYGILDSGDDTATAVVEMAACAGLPLAEGRKSAGKTTTYGVGELIAHAIEGGSKHVIVGAGGSATTDLGCGAAAALGVRFYNRSDEEFVPVGSTLKDVARIDATGAEEILSGISVTVMCDIDNPLAGPNGAAYIFGPQKGADPDTVKELDSGLIHVANIIKRDLEIDIAQVPGAGAAGGLGGGLLAFTGAELRPGIDTLLEAVRFTDIIKDADLIITGEGQIDGQSLSGKVPVGVSRWAAKHRGPDLPVVVLAGSIGEGIDDVYAEGVTAVFPIARRPGSLSEAIEHTAGNLTATAKDVARLTAFLTWERLSPATN